MGDDADRLVERAENSHERYRQKHRDKRNRKKSRDKQIQELQSRINRAKEELDKVKTLFYVANAISILDGKELT